MKETWDKYGDSIKQQVPGFDLRLFWLNVLSGPRVEHSPGSYKPVFATTLFKKEQESWIDLENNLAACLKMQMPDIDFGVLNAIFSEFLLPKFEQYVAEEVNRTTARRRLEITSADLVLSFNYSNTFDRLYCQQRIYPTKSNAKICYINGKAQANATQSNIVFGCDCFEDPQKGKSTIGFDKVFQRAHKNTDDSYKAWILLGETHSCGIHIIGHSLGRTDWDILRPFLTAARNTTKVYYHNEESHTNLIFNMMGMVGREVMNQRTISFHPISELAIEPRASGLVY